MRAKRGQEEEGKKRRARRGVQEEESKKRSARRGVQEEGTKREQ
jgi:hypothetical protein